MITIEAAPPLPGNPTTARAPGLAWPVTLNIALYVLHRTLTLFVVPVYASIQSEAGVRLHPLAQLVIDLSDLAKAWWWAADPLVLGLLLAVLTVLPS